MTEDDVIEMARDTANHGTHASGEIIYTFYLEQLVAFAHLVAAKAIQKEQDRCCAIVFGQCESDNVAQRTVNAIRGKA